MPLILAGRPTVVWDAFLSQDTQSALDQNITAVMYMDGHVTTRRICAPARRGFSRILPQILFLTADAAPVSHALAYVDMALARKDSLQDPSSPK